MLGTVPSPLTDVSWFDLPAVLRSGDHAGELDRLRQEQPMWRSDVGLHVMSYDGCLDLLRDARFHQGAPGLLDDAGISDPVVRRQWLTALLGSQPADHDRLRRLVSPAFTPRAIASLRDYVVGRAGRAADRAVEHGRIEVMADLAIDIPPAVFCRMIGAPEEDAGFIGRLSYEILQIFARDPELAPTIEASTHELMTYVQGFIDARRREPREDDLISSLLRAEEDGERLTTDELMALAIEALEASTDNTSSQLGLVLHTAAERPDIWAELRRDASLIPAFVEEACRVAPRIVCNAKVSDDDLTHAGVEVPAGTPVWVTVPAALRDPSAFPDPASFRLDRETKGQNLNYGYGTHYCVGAHLARLEMCGVVEALTRRWRTIEPIGAPELDVNVGVVTVRSLELAVEPAD